MPGINPATIAGGRYLLMISGPVRESVPFIVAQPSPARYALSILELPDGRAVSAIARVWDHGDEVRCRLCPLGKCVAAEGLCVVAVNERVMDESAPLYSTAV